MTDLAVDVQTLSVEVLGMTFAALTWSPADPTGAPLALCLHGYPDTPWTWRERFCCGSSARSPARSPAVRCLPAS